MTHRTLNIDTIEEKTIEYLQPDVEAEAEAEAEAVGLTMQLDDVINDKVEY